MIFDMGMKLAPEDLLDGEVVVATKNANCIISVADVGLQKASYNFGLKAIGLDGKEALGGRLHLTNYRLVFASHGLNRATGRLSVFLPSITGVRDTSRSITKRLEVTTALQKFDFVIWGVRAFISKIETERTSHIHTPAALLTAVTQHPQAVGDAFQVSHAMDLVIRNGADFVDLTAKVVADPLSFANLLGLWELANPTRHSS